MAPDDLLRPFDNNLHPGETRALTPGVTITKLTNGVRVISDRMPHVQTVSVGTWVGTGARFEPARLNGAAHLLEHMVFKGTESRSAADIAQEVEAVGGQMNAYTGRETTGFFVKLLAEDLPLGLDIVGDLLRRPVLDPGEMELERSVVIQEIGMTEDTPDDLVFDLFQEQAFPGQALGRPILGTRETVNAMQPDDLRGYMAGNYLPERLVVAAAGMVDHEQLVALAEAQFGDLSASAEGWRIDDAAYEGGEKRAEDDLEQIHLLLGFEGIGIRHNDLQAMTVFSTLLGGGMSSRLFQEIREKRGLVYAIYSFHQPFSDSGLFGVYAGTGPERIGELVPVLCDEIMGAAEAIPAEELARAKAQVRAGILMGLENSLARAEYWAGNTLTYGVPPTPDRLIADVDDVDQEAIRRVAARLLSQAPTVTALGRTDALEPYDQLRDRLRMGG